MEKVCFLFSGQGSQYTGMGKELLDICPQAQEIYQCGSDILGFDLKETCFNADSTILSQTKISQPAIFATSLVALTAVKSLGISASAVAGHSLGEYAALIASEMITLEQGFTLIKYRANAMSQTGDVEGAMAAIIGLSAQEVTDTCAEIDGYVVPVNFNSPKQTVIAGEKQAVELAMNKFVEMGKKAMKLAVSAAFHSKLMQNSADIFYNDIKDMQFKLPILDFYSNKTGEKLTDFSDMPTYLKNHLVSPVQFVSELNTIKDSGCQTFIECGPNKVLTGLVKKTLSEVVSMNVENTATFEKLKQLL